MSDMIEKTIKGNLGILKQSDVKGVLWCFTEEGNNTSSGAHCVGDGDVLTIFADAARQTVIWQRTIKYDREIQREPYPTESGLPLEYRQRGGQKIGDLWIDNYHGVPEGIEPQKWLSMFREGKPATLRTRVEDLDTLDLT